MNELNNNKATIVGEISAEVRPSIDTKGISVIKIINEMPANFKKLYQKNIKLYSASNFEQ